MGDGSCIAEPYLGGQGKNVARGVNGAFGEVSSFQWLLGLGGMRDSYKR